MYRSNTTVLRAYARSRIAATISLCAIVSILISPFSNIAYAATGVPRILNNQGRLMDGSGNLLGGSGTNYCFRFAFYDNPTVGNGTKVWPAASPSTMTVEVKNGIYNVGIGDVNAGGDVLDYNFEDNDAIYLNVEVATRVGATCAPGDGAESFENLSPRQRIYAAGYSINASSLRGYLPYQSASSTQIPVLSDGNLYLGGVNPYINATSSFVLTLQGGGQATGDINFFNAGNRITAAGDATFAGTISAQSATFTAATSSSFTVTGTASTSNLVVSNAFTFGTSTGILKAIAGVVTSTLVNLATDITGVLGIGNGGTGTSTAPGYGQVLLGNALGGYDLVSTTSLGINSAQWGSITGNLADQTDLQNVLDTKLSFSTWYATTTDALDEGLTNRYYQDSRVQTYLDTIAKSYFFASSSADYWKTQNNFFSTSSADYYTLANNFFSTTSADYLLSTYDKGFFFSSTSADAWSITKNFFATSSADYWKTQSDFFSTSSAAYFASAGLAFSTTSSDAWKDVRNFFSTSSAAYFASAGLAFSTTSSDYWETQQTARTADDLSNDSIEALNDVAAMTEAYGDVFTWNGSSWTNVSTSSLGLPTTQTLASYLTLTDWYATTTQDIAEGGSNLYFTNGRVQTYLATVDKGFFFSTTSADVWKGDRDFFSTTSNEYWKSVSNFFSTSSANFYSASNNFFSTTSATYFADASTTIAKTYSSNVFVAPQTFNGGLTISVLNGPLHANNGVVSATTSVGVTYGGTGRTDAPAYGQLLVGNALGGYDLLATTSLGINSGVWGAITGNIADQTDLQNALNQRLALVDWYATTTQDIAEGGTNLYYQDARVQTYLDTIAKSYFFASTSADYWKTQNNFFSTSSADYYTLANNFFSTSSADYWKTQSNFFSTTSADYWETQQTARTADDLTDNSIEDLQDVAAMTQGYGDLFFWNGSAWANIATSSLALNFTDIAGVATDAQVANDLTIDGGSINNSAIGSSGASTGVFTNATTTNFFTQYFSTSQGTFGIVAATSSASLASTTAYGRFITGNLVATSTATSTIEGPLSVGIQNGSYKVSILGSTTGPSSATGTAILAISNDSTTLSSGTNVMRLNIRTPYAQTCTSATTCPRFIEYFSGVGSGNDTGGRGVGSLRLSTNGTGITQTSGSADFAEFMQLNGPADFGDIVSLNAQGEYQKAVAGQSIVGVISESPAFVGNANIEGEPNAYIVGFAGVVPTTVSAANGAINAGDLITASTTEGVGVKLTQSGYAVGQALESYSGVGNGTIDVLVMPKYVDASVALASYGGGGGGISGYLSLATSTGEVTLASTTYSLVLGNKLTAQNASTTLLSSVYASSTQAFFGALSVGSLTGVLRASAGAIATGAVNLASEVTGILGIANGGTGTSTAPTYGQVLLGNALGGYDLVSTTSLGINSGEWGSITGNIADQTDLQNVLDTKLSFSTWYATTTDALDEGLTNRYYQDTRVQTYLDTIAKSYFFSSTSADYWKTQNNFFSTSSADYYTLANNFFSTTSADYLLSTYDKGFFFSTTSADAWSITKNFFSTSSADYWKTQSDFFSTSSAAYFASAGLSFSTTSNDAWKDVRNFFSTSSAAYFASAGLAFSTTSSDYWKSQNNFFSTTSAQNFTAQGLSFSTTSADAWKAVSSFFSTSSSDYWKAQNNFFSTSSASFFASAGLAFSTTSAEYFVGSSSTIPKTYTANTFTGENTFNGNTTLVNATATTLFATIASSSSLYGAGLSSCTGGNMLTWSGGTFGCAADQVGVSAAFPFTSGVFGATAVNATTTALQLQGGLYASSTVRFGNAGASQFLFDSTTGRLGLGTSSPYAKLSVQAAIDDAPGTLFAIGSTSPTGNRSLFAVESSGLTTFGDAAGTGDATFQFASDANAWVVGYNEADKSFRIASSTNLNTNVALEIDKGGTTILQTLQLPAIANCTQALETNAQGQIVCGTDVTGGGAGGSGVWATTTNDLAQYPTDPSRVVIIGASATSSIGNILEVAGNARVSGIASTTNLVVSSAFTFGSGSGILKAAAGVVSTGLLNLTNEVTEFLGVANGGTGTSTAPTYGQVLLGNALGGYDLVSTSSLGIQSGGGTWGSITGTLSNQTDLQNALDAKLSLVDWYATTTQDIAEGGTNLYYQDSRVQTYLDTIAKSFFFSSTSADYWKMQNNFFSTSSADYYTLANNFFSTSSAAYFASAGLAFSTTSSDYWKSQNNFFSTTSADYWKLTNDFFSTTSSLYFAAAGLAFSTTSSDYWETQQTARTADDLSDNSIEDLNDVAAMTESFGDLISWNGSSWTNIATSSLALNIADTIGTLLANRGGTGQTSYVEGDILYASDANTLTRLAVGSPGTVLKVSGGGVPVWGTDLTVGGGGGGGAWSTTSTDLLLYPTDTTDVIVVGTNATSTDSSIFEVSGKSYFSNNVGIGTTTAGSLLSIGGVANFAAAGSTLYSPFAFTSGVTMRGDLTVEGQTTLGNASTTNISASYASSTEAFFGSLSVGNLTGVLKATAGAVTASALDLVSDVTGILGISNGGTGTSTAPTYGQVLLGNALGGYDLVSTSSLGIQGGGGGTWGSITGTLADQTDLQNALNAKLSLTDWYATTTQDLAEGGTNLYYQDSRVQTYLDTIGKGYYFSTTSAQHFAAIGLAFSTTSSDFWRTARNFFSTTSAEFFVQSSSTIPKTYTNNTFTGANQFVGSTQAGALVANALSASTFGVGTVSTSTIQGGAVGTSTLQGFLNVLGTNSTSTFSAGLAANRLNITGVNATSTASGGFNITDGCYAIDGICIGGAGGGVTSVSNVDGTLTISPTTGAVVASLNLSNANIWTGLQRFGNASSTAFSALDYMAIGRTATTTIQGSTSGTSTLQGFINVLGTNSTSTFSGGLAANRINVTGSGTSTFAGGINVTSGCVAVNGTCLGTGSGGDAGFGVEAVEVFTTPGANSWIKPSYVNSVFVEVWGGGGGGGTAGANASDGGGGGGAYSAGIVTVDGNETATVGAVGTSNGGAGGTSSFTTNGTTVTATGGTGTTGLTGGAGGTASNGTINLSGQKGGNGLAADGGRSGDGGGSPRGGDGGKGKGGGNAAGGTGLAGENGLMPGGGGGGGAESNGVGGAGAQGMIVVWELSGTNGSDLAEMYATEPGVGPGDVVAIGSESIEYDSEWGLQEITVLKKADGNGKAVGVVATAPAVVMGRTINTDNSENPQPIALAGRTPVKIASSSAIIKEGDLIALSSQPGYAQKTEKAGEILGWALEDYDPASASGTVMIFVHTGYSSGARTKAILENAGIDTDTIPAHTDIGRMLLAQAISKKQDITASTTLSEVLTDRLYAGLEVIAPRVLTDTLVTNVIEPVDKNVDLRLLEDGVFTISRVGRDMMSVSFGAAASTSSSTLAVSIDAIGNALFAGTLTAANFEIGSKDKPGGLTMYDTASGEPYCTRITGGTLQTVPGKCNEGVNLDALATQAPEPPSSDAPSSGTTELGVDGSPSIVLNGKNPARVDVGDEYVDLGVMVSDDKDTNLAVTLFVDGSEVDAIQIDTSVSKEYVITYQVTDSDSHVTQKDRTVIVEAPSETAAAEESGEAVAPTAAPADEPAVEVQPEPSTQPADASHDTENSANNPASEPESAPAQSESEPLATTAPVTETEPIE